MNGLIIDEPHIGNILNGRKDWEIRTKPFPYPMPETIGLLTKQSHRHPHCILGYAEVVDSIPKPPLQMLNYNQRHQASSFIQNNSAYMNARVLYAYEIGDLWILPAPDPYVYQRGQVVWVNI